MSRFRIVVYEDIRCERHLEVTQNASKDPLPEIPSRTRVIGEALRNASFSDMIKFESPKPATTEELLDIHEISHIVNIEKHVALAKETQSNIRVNGDGDVIVSDASDIAARYAAGAVRTAVQAVLSPGYTQRAFCNVRPPGHHAHHRHAAGFCLYNNVWFGAQEARKFMINILGKSAPRIAIIDWDVHHGDGTQNFVLRNTELYTYFVSIHQQHNTQYPMTGKECKKTRQNSVVVNHNIRPNGGDDEVKQYFNNTLTDDLLEWKPDLILISCGFDAHVLDPVGKLQYSSELYGWMTKQLVKVADQCCNGRIVSVLEGGYSLQALQEASVEHVAALLQHPLNISI